jgi:ComF family protein
MPGILNNCLKFSHALLPQSCLLCGARSARALLCPACDADLPRLPAARCTICAAPANDPLCGACIAHLPRYDAVTAVFVYQHPLDALVQAFKYGGNLALATLLGDALGQTVAASTDERADLIIPMPLSARRLRERGFNQAVELARRVGRITGVTVASGMCRKIVDTQPQAALPWKARAQNVRGAFVCDADLQGKNVAVIDDVMTTGATLNELARNLRRAGAAHISGWVVARALRNSAI